MPRELRITVDHDLCMGNGQCVFLAPEVFRHNENRQSEVVDSDGAPRERVLQAASYCPTGAIAVADAATDEDSPPLGSPQGAGRRGALQGGSCYSGQPGPGEGWSIRSGSAGVRLGTR